jgi:hypothetical protein
VYQVSYKQLACNFKSTFGIVVAVVIQSVFRLKIYQNKKNNFLKIIFNISTSKRKENIKKIYFKQKNSKFLET